MSDPAVSLPARRDPLTSNPLTPALAFIGETVTLTASGIKEVLRGRIDRKQLVLQMCAIGVDALPIVLAITFCFCAVFAFYTSAVFVRFGAGDFAGGTLAYGVLNELGPVLCGIAVAARSGTAIAAEIGTMVVTEQVDALRALAVSPTRYLVVPRLLAAVLTMPLLCLFSDAAGIYGSYVMSVAKGVTSAAFINSARAFVSMPDLITGLIKATCFGVLISVVSCRQGLTTSGGAVGVGRATTSSVVLCIVLIFIVDLFLAQVLATTRGLLP